jgi:hypothetical protein
MPDKTAQLGSQVVSASATTRKLALSLRRKTRPSKFS